MDDSTRESGSFTNLSDSGSCSTTWAACNGRRRRSTARPRVGTLTGSTAFVTARPRRSLLGTRRRFSVRSRGVVVVPQLTGVAGDNVSVQLDLVHRSTAHSTCARGSARTSFSSSTSERLNCSKSTVVLTDVRSTTVSSLEIRAHVANCC